MHISYKFYDIK